MRAREVIAFFDSLTDTFAATGDSRHPLPRTTSEYLRRAWLVGESNSARIAETYPRISLRCRTLQIE
jgi:hypothetical protein